MLTLLKMLYFAQKNPQNAENAVSETQNSPTGDIPPNPIQTCRHFNNETYFASQKS